MSNVREGWQQDTRSGRIWRMDTHRHRASVSFEPTTNDDPYPWTADVWPWEESEYLLQHKRFRLRSAAMRACETIMARHMT